METKYLRTAETAKLIRNALKKAFPSVKFSVRCSRGGSVNIDWTDGPTTKQVDAVAGAFESGRFDPSIDYGYSVSHWLLPDGTVQIAHNPGSACTMGYDEGCDNPQPHPNAIKVHFGARFVFTNRSYSAGMLRRALDKVARQWGGFDPAEMEIQESCGSHWVNSAGSMRIENAGRYLDELLHRELSRRTTVASIASMNTTAPRKGDVIRFENGLRFEDGTFCFTATFETNESVRLDDDQVVKVPDLMNRNFWAV